MDPPPLIARPVFLDAHVHLRRGFDVQVFLRHAYRNFHAFALQQCQTESFSGVLLLTEAANEYSFAALKKSALDSDPTLDRQQAEWTIVKTRESCSLLAISGNRKLALVAGCQIFSAERLELLVLGTEDRVHDGLPLSAVLKWARSSRLIHILPWAPGRWLFGRGTIIDQLIQSSLCDFFLGDNGGRPWFWPVSPKLAQAQIKGIRLLSGSDPLPFPGEHRRPGSFGSYAHFGVDWTQPWFSVQQNLRKEDLVLHSYGHPIGALSFLAKEVGMQLTKRRRRRENYYGTSN